MLKHETKLIDPDADEIVATLTQAAADANKRCRARLLADDPTKWRKFARDCGIKPEGWEMFRGGKGGIPATQVLAAWWTDSIGRKHVVVRGRRVEHDEAKRLLSKDELDARPPLWHAYPEYVCRRTVGSNAVLVCACGCGAVGTPQALGWMGETCGPCFDRAQDDGPEALRANVPGVLYGDRSPLGSVACSPDGTRAAATEAPGLFSSDGTATYWDLATRTRTVMKFTHVRVSDMAFTSDSAKLVVTGVPYAVGGLLATFDLSADPPKRLDDPNAARPVGWRVAPLPDPNHVLVHRPDATGPHTNLETVRVPSDDVVRTIRFPPGYSGQFALSPDGTKLATAGAVAVYLVGSGIHVSDVDGHYPHVAFSADGERAIGGHGAMLKSFDVFTGAPDGPAARVGAPGTTITALAVDPLGEWVYFGGTNGSVTVLDAKTFARRAVFAWHLGFVTGLAVSADGSRLFSAGGDGCVKVWPVRNLMRGIKAEE